MRVILAILASTIFVFNAFCQEAAYFEGQLLVHPTAEEKAIDKLIETYDFISIEKKLAPNLNVYLLSFDATLHNHQEVLRQVQLSPYILIAQNNHKIDYRDTTPNDPGFGNQWQYVNNGGAGGVVDADIDAELAWDITTGGVTPLGDEIVICVVDDGINPNQSDFGDNVWFNDQETPNNGIDDDGNGFIDDYDGWDSYNNNDNVYETGYTHGTSVAAIVGAQGNNNFGVTGVNWDVKLMIVEGGGGESDALAAYAYPLAMRKLYNATSGAKGAFVVATNSSWGVDFGQAANAPLWCAMYDSMGAAGILSAGATINDNVNVDVQGDLPTQCSSDYLITVTNMQRDDTKDPFAGYGVTTIDIGAHGTDTYTAESFGNGFGPFGGTSGATPHVAGAVGLIYAAPCQSFANLYMTNPAQAALKAKDYIMNGGDPNASIASSTVSGNRLNLYGALMELDDDCINCPVVETALVSDITINTATIAYAVSSPVTVNSFVIRYRELGAPNWITVNSNTNSIQLSNLDPQTIYEFQIQSVCDDGSGSFSDIRVFNTSAIGINHLSENDASVRVYPNPTNGIVTIAYEEIPEHVSVRLTDVIGNTLFEGVMKTEKKLLNISSLQSGVYFITLTNSEGKLISKKIQKL